MYDLDYRHWIPAAFIVMSVFSTQGHGEQGGALSDPTRPQGWQPRPQGAVEQVAPKDAALQLQGTYSLAGRRSAIISGQRVMVGDEVSGAKVVEINKNRVVLQRDGEEIELASLVPDVKSPASSRGAAR